MKPLGLPLTPDAFFAVLSRGERCIIDGYRYSPEVWPDGVIVWIENDYGIECGVFPLTAEIASKVLAERLSGQHIGPRAEECHCETTVHD